MKTIKEIERDLIEKEHRVQYFEIYGVVPDQQDLRLFEEYT